MRCGLLGLGFLTCLGCGGGYSTTAEIVPTAPVSGTLMFKGKPLEHYQVVFMPTDGSRPATGVADAAGKFVLGTNKAGDGAPIGTSKIAINFVGPQSEGDAGAEAIIDDPSKLPKPKIKIPAKFHNPDTSGLTQEVSKKGIPDLVLDLQ